MSNPIIARQVGQHSGRRISVSKIDPSGPVTEWNTGVKVKLVAHSLQKTGWPQGLHYLVAEFPM